MHCSVNPAEAEHEIKLWFKPDEIIVDLYPSKELVVSSVKQRVWL
jgi:nucleoside-diphosphate kinase